MLSKSNGNEKKIFLTGKIVIFIINGLMAWCKLCNDTVLIMPSQSASTWDITSSPLQRKFLVQSCNMYYLHPFLRWAKYSKMLLAVIPQQYNCYASGLWEIVCRICNLQHSPVEYVLWRMYDYRITHHEESICDRLHNVSLASRYITTHTF